MSATAPFHRPEQSHPRAIGCRDSEDASICLSCSDEFPPSPMIASSSSSSSNQSSEVWRGCSGCSPQGSGSLQGTWHGRPPKKFPELKPICRMKHAILLPRAEDESIADAGMRRDPGDDSAHRFCDLGVPTDLQEYAVIGCKVACNRPAISAFSKVIDFLQNSNLLIHLR
jgi:hypothetical protein